MKLHPWLAHMLRFGFAALVVWLLVHAGALNPALLAAAVAKHPFLCLLAFLIYLIPIQLFAWLRWYWLLRAAKVPLSMAASFRLHLVGLFFNGFLPGGTGGDLAKGWYLLKGRSRTESAAALGTMVADRVTGLFGLIGLAAAANLINMRAWDSSPILTAQAVFILSLAGAILLLTLAFLAPWKISLRSRDTVTKDGEPRGFLAEFALALASFRKYPGAFLGAIGLSVAVHLCLIGVYALCAAALDSSLPFRLHAYVAPTLTLANGIPVSPAGLGVGEAAGMVLYKAVGATHGFAEIPALVHAVSIAVALLAAPAYLLRKK
ncbi:MAG TPA: lysylphosphatidylglycerol synthase transmembrane domain-containing protein [Fibrobacteria bacterium]|nr:lysylphosphatidylglycerol synthase transmembrane domain-containing protein [Fibrobacteria bacterium]